MSDTREDLRIELLNIFVENMSDIDRSTILKLPSAQPEVKPIDYRDCSCALLKMWIENVLTDSEYSRIQGKLSSSDFAKEGLRVPVSYQEEQNE